MSFIGNRMYAQAQSSEYMCEDEWGGEFESDVPCDQIPCVRPCYNCKDSYGCNESHICSLPENGDNDWGGDDNIWNGGSDTGGGGTGGDGIGGGGTGGGSTGGGGIIIGGGGTGGGGTGGGGTDGGTGDNSTEEKKPINPPDNPYTIKLVMLKPWILSQLKDRFGIILLSSDIVFTENCAGNARVGDNGKIEVCSNFFNSDYTDYDRLSIILHEYLHIQNSISYSDEYIETTEQKIIEYNQIPKEILEYLREYIYPKELYSDNDFKIAIEIYQYTKSRWKDPVLYQDEINVYNKEIWLFPNSSFGLSEKYKADRAFALFEMDLFYNYYITYLK